MSRLRQIIARTTACATRWATNGPLRKGFALALEYLDDRRTVRTVFGTFTVRVGNTLERWRADTALSKEPDTIAWLDGTLRPDSVFYDVGANIGLYTLYAMHRFPETLRSVCFEPESMNFARLNQNIVDNRFSRRAIAFSIALGQGDTVGTFRLSSFQAGRALHGDRYVADGTEEHVQGLASVSLDDLMARAGSELPPPTHLKIDVDGPELAILVGASQTLTSPTLRHLLIELEASERDTAHELLSNVGFHLVAEGDASNGISNVIYEKRTEDGA